MAREAGALGLAAQPTGLLEYVAITFFERAGNKKMAQQMLRHFY